MMIDELKIAYLELQVYNEKLKNELNSLQQGTTEAETEMFLCLFIDPENHMGSLILTVKKIILLD